jgi:hypothetical protein
VKGKEMELVIKLHPIDRDRIEIFEDRDGLLWLATCHIEDFNGNSFITGVMNEIGQYGRAYVNLLNSDQMFNLRGE